MALRECAAGGVRLQGIPAGTWSCQHQWLPLTHPQYWNWDRYAKDPANSPLFDGSEGSMGGNGAQVAHQGIPIPGAPSPYNIIPPGDGGGCVTTGPFKK
jgi:tyrosinase